MRLDDSLPEYHFREQHSLQVNASPQLVFKALKELQPGEMAWPVAWMMALRGLPGWLKGKRSQPAERALSFLDQMEKNGFMYLAEEPGRELVFGLIGQFWKPIPAKTRVENAQAFIAFRTPGYAKAAANLLAEPKDNGTRLSTETRVWTPDEKTRRRFGLYWMLISLGSGWIRLFWLKAIKRKAEAAQRLG
jgi:hypothetical protein